ncbi:mitochondrial import receptor subunit TOM70-like [Amphibalanus amphitrite]|uniref:mitochondrial import receptor subunit TOM70-like n=1 Tax=Amphibalanus amphitrite TaxID=1232801 RepID=UPI001C91D228|nr:mitochondrial import receptor subunit TOM70-like [Amphibalanus amphitrite]
MAASSGAVSESGAIPKWQIALAVGTPVVLGVGYYLYKSSKTEDKGKKSSEKKDLVEKTASSESAANAATPPDPVPETPLDKARASKNKGNKYFKAQKYNEAIKCYDSAIELCPPDQAQDLSTFHQNRAAAHEQLGNHAASRHDCDRALQLAPRYAKALHRRAKACEALGELSQALRDVTAVCILEGFQNQATLMMADRVLKELGKRHAKEALQNRQPVMPSKHFVQTFLSSFAEDPLSDCWRKEDTSAPTADDADLRGWARACRAIQTSSYEDVVPACSEEIESAGPRRLEATLLRGTLHQLTGQNRAARDDYTVVIEDNASSSKLRVNALIKRGSIHLQLDAPEASVADFKKAIDIDEKNSDIYHHRGQINLLMEMTDQAMADFETAVKLKPDFPIACVQKTYTDYRHACATENRAKIAKVNEEFKSLISRFPNCSECYVLYAQVMADQEKFQEADELFKQAIQVDPDRATVYVHRGLLQLQWKGDVTEATKLISRSLELDDKGEFAYETLGTIEVQRGNLRRAMELFDKAIPFAKTEAELSHLFSLRDAAQAQAEVAQQLGISVPTPPGL